MGGDGIIGEDSIKCPLLSCRQSLYNKKFQIHHDRVGLCDSQFDFPKNSFNWGVLILSAKSNGHKTMAVSNEMRCWMFLPTKDKMKTVIFQNINCRYLHQELEIPRQVLPYVCIRKFNVKQPPQKKSQKMFKMYLIVHRH